MTSPSPSRPPDATERARRAAHVSLTAHLLVRQFGLLLLAATALLFVCFFINFYGISFWDLWNQQPQVDLRVVVVPAIPLFVYGYVLLNGVLFAMSPSERSFNLFFVSMVLALLATNFDHSVVNWFFDLFAPGAARQKHPVSAFKIAFASLFLMAVILMHYNILSDDFARRMLRRGVPTEEVARIRPGMFKVLIPTAASAGLFATGLALLGQLSAFIFQQNGLFLPKLELVLLAALVVPMAFLLKGILKELAAARKEEPPPGPNR